MIAKKDNQLKTKRLIGDKMKLEDKIKTVESILKDKLVAVAFSGGADSTLLAYLSSKVAKDTLAITIDNHIFPKDFIKNAADSAESFGVNHEIIDIDFYENEDFLKNDSARCYNCRDMMYSHIKEYGLKKGFDFICDGNNISDLVSDRPGILITYKNGFNTPFIEAKLTSKEIHEYLNRKDIPYSKSTTCLATRIPSGTKTTHKKVKRIGSCEDYILANTCCEIVKVRDFGDTAIVEVDNIEEILHEKRFNQINDELKRQGFAKVALNLSQIDDDEYIAIDYGDEKFSYQLPYTINLDETKKQIENIILDNEDKIELEKITIYENGLIEGHDLENYDLALDTFMEILPKIRRNI